MLTNCLRITASVLTFVAPFLWWGWKIFTIYINKESTDGAPFVCSVDLVKFFTRFSDILVEQILSPSLWCLFLSKTETKRQFGVSLNYLAINGGNHTINKKHFVCNFFPENTITESSITRPAWRMVLNLLKPCDWIDFNVSIRTSAHALVINFSNMQHAHVCLSSGALNERYKINTEIWAVPTSLAGSQTCYSINLVI